ncbi:MAG: TetR/AcrR family transcriptional regulator [Solirubrobacteraceae bacterium]|nr:TetR/AcrR family transcriptional regulator [Patulibacter sp.]
MVPPQSPRTDPRPARTRRAILAAADELLATSGVEGTTIAKVASHAGVSVGSIYAHFGSKDSLILALGAKAVEPRLAQMEADDATESSPLARVLAAADAYVRFAIDEPSTFSALVILAHEPQAEPLGSEGLGTELGDHIGGLLATLRDDLAAAMDAGELPRAPVRDALVGLLASWHGIADLATRRDGLSISADGAWNALAASRSLLLGGASAA